VVVRLVVVEACEGPGCWVVRQGSEMAIEVASLREKSTDAMKVCKKEREKTRQRNIRRKFVGALQLRWFAASKKV